MDETLAVLIECGSLHKAANKLGISRQALKYRLQQPKRRDEYAEYKKLAYGVINHLGRLDAEVQDGVVLIGSDAHIWPGEPTTAMRAFQWACKKLQPEIVCLNGDVVDAAMINRHDPLGWEKKPTFTEEVAAAQARLREVKKAARSAKRFVWTFGNHDANFERMIATHIPGLEGMPGVHLKDHFPDWEPCWSLWINQDELCIKHRMRGGIHAPWNNVQAAQVSIATGHLHSLKVMPFTSYKGTTWGVDTGTLAQPYGPQFIYTEMNAVNWRAGFAVFTFNKGRLLWPELVVVRDETSWEFRGQIYEG